MNAAHQLVARLLEDDPSSYDIDDPLERHDPAFYPAGFRAKRENGDERLFQLDLAESNEHKAVYKMSVYWIDDFIGGRRVLDSATYFAVKPEKAQEWLKAEAVRWQQHGWEVTWL